ADRDPHLVAGRRAGPGRRIAGQRERDAAGRDLAGSRRIGRPGVVVGAERPGSAAPRAAAHGAAHRALELHLRAAGAHDLVRADTVWPGPVGPPGVGSIVIFLGSLGAGRGPAGSLVVRVSVTLPAAISAAVGVYFAFIAVALGLNVPAPPLHVPLEAPPPTAP